MIPPPFHCEASSTHVTGLSALQSTVHRTVFFILAIPSVGINGADRVPSRDRTTRSNLPWPHRPERRRRIAVRHATGVIAAEADGVRLDHRYGRRDSRRCARGLTPLSSVRPMCISRAQDPGRGRNSEKRPRDTPERVILKLREVKRLIGGARVAPEAAGAP